MNEQELTGKTRSHIRQFESPRFAAHEDAADAFLKMKQSAADEGIELHPFSAFRDFEAQLKIWNLKYTGKRPLYAIDGQELDITGMSPESLVKHILNWSALPGGSRHHWGTEIDVIDTAALPDGYQVQLLPKETEEGGVFHQLHRWLDRNMERFGFFRPYARYQNGICAEPWHISYAPVSQPALASLSLELLDKTIAECSISGQKIIQTLLPKIFRDYILNIVPPEFNL
jgi:LAS superfamily LD-carboxypeptidase LdcB